MWWHVTTAVEFKEVCLSQEIKKARLRQLAADYQIEICQACINPTEDCNCQPVTVGQVVAIKEWKRLKEGLGAVRTP
jgi:hypothetical protein